jgi:pentapeptide MXKDX repeat protein
MKTNLRTLLSISALALSVGLAFPAFAQDKMGKDGMSNSMAKDTMSRDAMKKHDAMSNDAMKKHDAMAKDGMAKDGMKK